MRPSLLALLLGGSFVRCAINLDGTEAIEPAKADNPNDPSPIDGNDRYWPEQHDCPLVCEDYSNIHSWITYLSVDRLKRCQHPMLLQFSVNHPLDDPASTILIRSCSLDAQPAQYIDSVGAMAVENPKTAPTYLSRLHTAPACASDGQKVDSQLEVSSSGESAADGNRVARLLDGMRRYFEAGDNCDESFLFAYHEEVVVSVYTGSMLGRKTVTSALDALADRFRGTGSAAKHTVAQVCGQDPDRMFGIAVDTAGDLASVQQFAWEWSQGKCATANVLPEGSLRGAAVWEIGPTNIRNNTAFGANNTSSDRHHWNDTLPISIGQNGTFAAQNATSGGDSKSQSLNQTYAVSASSNDTSNSALRDRNGTLLHGNNSTSPGSRILSSISSFLKGTGSFNAIAQKTPGNSMPASRATSISEINSTFDSRTHARWISTTSRGSFSGSRDDEPASTISSDMDVTRTWSSRYQTSNTGHPRGSKTSVSGASDPQETGSRMETKGNLSCQGSFTALTPDRRESVVNGTIDCYGSLFRNGSLTCNGAISRAHSGQGDILRSQGTLTCNGTLDRNGSVVRGPASCNGTWIPPNQKAAFQTNEFFTCNGTLSSNSTFGAAFTPESPGSSQTRNRLAVRQASGTCATHLIQNGDTCAALAEKYGVTVSNIEKWNKGKTWAWTECKNMLVGYNLCVSAGSAPMPPPQQGTQCGPLVPDTKPPKAGESLADLNPCPLKACCSNWGFCGVFPSHCAVHAPEGGGPGTKKPGFQNTCVSNCETEIKQNSGPPAAFGRVGYYSAFAYERECLHLEAKHANTDGSYTVIHWAFAEIDPITWKVVIKDKGNQWNDFKALTGVKRVVSFGGWAYSTEPATYNIIRQAILTKWDVFIDNIVQFVKKEGLDGVDFDWEYPGAPDILVGGRPIGETTDGTNYLSFLRILRATLPRDKTIAIAAPASFWYLKAFPIVEISTTIDYVVYMTYDLHGQWDYGNVNAFDQCGSGKCIRSHVNLTETRNALAMITKAGVANNKIFVGEASYGRTFHMAQDGCWGPLCEFTGSRTHSDAHPGRCTNTGGYLANAEIQELMLQPGAQTFHDGSTNTDVMLYKGDYVSYMTKSTKDTRRSDWKGLNFAGSIDWALDLQDFTSADTGNLDIPSHNGEGCIAGKGYSDETFELCAFACDYGFCPESICHCTESGKLVSPPPETGSVDDVETTTKYNLDLTRLCKWSCLHGFCPDDVCVRTTTSESDNSTDYNNFESDARWGNSHKGCVTFKGQSLHGSGIELRTASLQQCQTVCKKEIDEAKAAGRMYNYGCMVNRWNGTEPAWETAPGAGYTVASGECICDNWVFNEIANSFLEALPAIAEISCYILMSSLKTVLSFGLDAVTGPAGRIIDAGTNALGAAAQLASYTYDKDQDPQGAFDFWLSPCAQGDESLVPEDLKKGFDIANSIADGATSFKTPKRIGKGSGRKGDQGNPRGKPSTSKPPTNPPNGNGNNGGVNKNKKCHIPPAQKTKLVNAAKNTVRIMSCDKDVTKTQDFVVTSMVYAPNAAATVYTGTCSERWTQPCHHYSSAIAKNPSWKTLTCPQEAATPTYRLDGSATESWTNQRTGGSKEQAGKRRVTYNPAVEWLNEKNRQQRDCDRDEYPPAYLLNKQNVAYTQGGISNAGQNVRYLHAGQNRGAGSMWKGVCFSRIVKEWTIDELLKKVKRGNNLQTKSNSADWQTTSSVYVSDKRPEFTIGKWQHKVLPNDGLDANQCRPTKMTKDPGFAIFDFDPWYQNAAQPWNYQEPYQRGTNGD